MEFGDPLFNPNDVAADFGSFEAQHSGFFTASFAGPDSTRPLWGTLLNAPVVSTCFDGDFVCGLRRNYQVGPTYWSARDFSHLNEVANLRGISGDVINKLTQRHSEYLAGATIPNAVDALLRKMNLAPVGKARMPLDVKLVVDSSAGSALVLAGLKRDLPTLLSEISSESTDVQVGLVEFKAPGSFPGTGVGSAARTTTPLNSDTAAVTSGVNGLTPSGGSTKASNGETLSSGFSGLRTAIDGGWREGARREVLLVSTSGILNPTDAVDADFNGPETGTGLTFQRIAAALDLTDIRVDSVLLSDNMNTSAWAEYVGLDRGTWRSGGANSGAGTLLAPLAHFSYVEPFVGFGAPQTVTQGVSTRFQAEASSVSDPASSIGSYAWSTSEDSGGGDPSVVSDSLSTRAKHSPRAAEATQQPPAAKNDQSRSTGAAASIVGSPYFDHTFTTLGSQWVQVQVCTTNYCRSRYMSVNVVAPQLVRPAPNTVTAVSRDDQVTLTAKPSAGAPPIGLPRARQSDGNDRLLASGVRCHADQPGLDPDRGREHDGYFQLRGSCRE